MAEGWTLNSDQSESSFIEYIKARRQRKKFIRVEIFDSARTIPQNSTFYKLYDVIGRTLYGGDIEQARRECKLYIGAKILRRDDPAYAEVYDLSVRSHSDENKLKIMAFFPVTRNFSIDQGKEYIDRIINTYSSAGVDFSFLDKPKK